MCSANMLSGGARPIDLTNATFASPVVQAVLDMLSHAQHLLDIDPEQARIFIERASDLLTPVSPPRAAPPVQSTARRASGLAPWQARKVSRHIAENLGQPLRVAALAALVSLSHNHFSRSFKGTFGAGPREYVTHRRLEHVKVLMIQTDLSLCQIALDCGFCDQAHMCRTFHAVVGSAPGHWRRRNNLSVAA